MTHKIAVLSLSLCLSSIAMEQKGLISWVQKTDRIQVASSMQKTMGTYSIDVTTTVGDIKTKIHDSEGIPAHQQSLLPLIPYWWFFETNGQELDDTANIKQVMSMFKTKRFLVWLSLRPAHKK